MVFRAECSADFERFLEAGGDVVVSEALSVVYGPTSTVFPDRVYAFFLLAEKVFDDVVSVLENMKDAHCMLETLAPIEQYTGKRTLYRGKPFLGFSISRRVYVMAKIMHIRKGWIDGPALRSHL